MCLPSVNKQILHINTWTKRGENNKHISGYHTHTDFYVIIGSSKWSGGSRSTGRRYEGSSHHDDDLELPIFDLGTIAAATDGFSINNKLGEGGFGPVYKVQHYMNHPNESRINMQTFWTQVQWQLMIFVQKNGNSWFQASKGNYLRSSAYKWTNNDSIKKMIFWNLNYSRYVWLINRVSSRMDKK